MDATPRTYPEHIEVFILQLNIMGYRDPWEAPGRTIFAATNEYPVKVTITDTDEIWLQLQHLPSGTDGQRCGIHYHGVYVDSAATLEDLDRLVFGTPRNRYPNIGLFQLAAHSADQCANAIHLIVNLAKWENEPWQL